MLIDVILDRKDGAKYDPLDFAFAVNDYAGVFPELMQPVLKALESKDERRVKHALCGYVLEGGYNSEICDYVNSVNWLPAWWDMD